MLFSSQRIHVFFSALEWLCGRDRDYNFYFIGKVTGAGDKGLAQGHWHGESQSYNSTASLLASQMLFLCDMTPITKPAWLAKSQYSHTFYMFMCMYILTHYQIEMK